MRRNILRQGAVVAMAVLLAIPALPVRAVGAGNGTAVVPEMSAADAEITGEEVNYEPFDYRNGNMADIVSGGNAETYEMSLSSGNPRAGASTGIIGLPDENGNVLEWSYDDSTQTLTVTGSGVTQGGELSVANFGSMGIKKIVFQDCKVTGSMRRFFDELRGVEEIDLSGADTSGVTKMDGMFYGCSSLTSLDLGTFDTVNVTDMADMFGFCSGLTSLDLRTFDTRNVMDMEGMFSGCSSLTSLYLGSFNTRNVTRMGSMFSGCSSLISLNLGSFDTVNVMEMWEMFSGCSSLISLDLGSFDTVNVTNMRNMFSGCSGLISLDLGSFDTVNVTNMGNMFSGCSSLTVLDLGSFDTVNVTNMWRMFFSCSGLIVLDLGSFDTINVTNMRNMFSGCSGLISLDLGSFDTVNVTKMDGMFSGCSSLTSLDLGTFDTVNVTDMGSMFSGCSNLTSLDLGTFDTINVTDMGWMFSGCSSLTSFDLGTFDIVNVTDTRGMFYGCSSLTSLDLGSFDTINVTDMGWMFSGCSSLTSLDLGTFDTINVTDMVIMFSGCSSLTSLDLGSFDTGNVTDMGGMLSGCNNLSMLHTPYNVGVSAALPTVSDAVWHLPDGTEVTEMPQNLGISVLLRRTPVITTTTETLNMPDVIRVKYVPYSYTVQTDNTNPDNQVTFSIVEGRLAQGLQMYPATGEIYGVPLEAGEFRITVQADYSNPKYPSSRAELTLIVLDNTDDNVGTATDSGYEITQPVPNLNTGSLSGSGTQLLVSEGEYAEFQDAVYLDGRRLQSGVEYTSEAGSTRITIQNQTLADAGAGSHTLSLEFRTQDTGALRRAAQNLVISGVGSSGDSENNGNPDDSGNGSGTPGDSGNGSGTPGDSGNGSGTPGDSGNGSGTPGDSGNGGEPSDDSGNNSGTPDGSGNNNGMSGDGGNNSVTPDNNTGSSGNTDDDADDGGQDAAPASNAVTVINYIVQSGDNLWKIAARFYGDGRYWRQIYMDNADVIRYPDRLRTGWHLKIRLTAGNGTTGAAAAAFNAAGTIMGSSYTVQPGDNLWRIAGKVYGKSERWREIYEANRNVLSSPEHIYAKQVLVIP